jgi:hypothetical protein
MIVDVEDPCLSLLDGERFHRFNSKRISINQSTRSLLARVMRFSLTGSVRGRHYWPDLRELPNESISKMGPNVDAVHRTAGRGMEAPDR